MVRFNVAGQYRQFFAKPKWSVKAIIYCSLALILEAFNWMSQFFFNQIGLDWSILEYGFYSAGHQGWAVPHSQNSVLLTTGIFQLCQDGLKHSLKLGVFHWTLPLGEISNRARSAHDRQKNRYPTANLLNCLKIWPNIRSRLEMRRSTVTCEQKRIFTSFRIFLFAIFIFVIV